LITRNEIEAKGVELGVKVADAERDYVFGWLLSAIYAPTSGLGHRLLPKGGNGLRKAYFPYARFSADLDFSTQIQVDPDDVGRQLNGVFNHRFGPVDIVVGHRSSFRSTHRIEPYSDFACGKRTVIRGVLRSDVGVCPSA